MKKLIYFIILLLTCRICSAQNLVPNGDFEQYLGCPNSLNQLDSTLYWLNPSTNNPALYASPDYYNQCDFNLVSVPANWVGFQYAHSGVAYSGIFLLHFTINEYREYIEVPLLTTLVANNCYHLEMHVSLADESRYLTSELGAYFSDTLIHNLNTSNPLPYTPQINNITTNVFDTINWTVVNGTYTAIGTENYLIIGNFKDDANTPYSFYGNGNEPAVYIYIDDVCLTPCGNSCTTGIEENERVQIKVYPNPFSDKINLTSKRNELVEVNLIEVTGRKIFKQSFTNSISINTEQLAKGIYLYEVRNKNGVIKKGKVVKD